MKARMGRGAPRSSSPPRLYQVLWTVAIMNLSASRPLLCPQESIRLLDTFMKEMFFLLQVDLPRPTAPRPAYGLKPELCQVELGFLVVVAIQKGNSSNIGPLYTPEDITVCYANNLDCFYQELQVIQEEQEEPSNTLSRLIRRMAQLTRKQQRTGEISRCTIYPPCHDHPEKPAMAFLRRLLEMFQWRCSAKDLCPSPGPGNSTFTPQATSSSPTSTAKDHQV